MKKVLIKTFNGLTFKILINKIGLLKHTEIAICC